VQWSHAEAGHQAIVGAVDINHGEPVATACAEAVSIAVNLGASRLAVGAPIST
jgi:hypothetical protein